MLQQGICQRQSQVFSGECNISLLFHPTFGLGKFIGAFSDLTQDSQENETKKTKRRSRRKIQSQYLLWKTIKTAKQLSYGLK